MKLSIIAILVIGALAVNADLYMHNPRGSINRLNENNQNRNNADRLFDSQNNDRGGYNVGDENAANDGNGVMQYYEGSILMVEWTCQHGANNPNMIGEIILQYMCNEQLGIYNPAANGGIRDGSTTNRIDTGNPSEATRGKHEPVAMYNDCNTRERNKGLFLADQEQNLDENNENTAVFTRQNTNGNRHGFECAEEREYYPYWHPTPWVDAAVLTSDPSRCAYYEAHSANVMEKGYCTNAAHNNPTACTGAGATWATQAPLTGTPPDCQELGWSRDNHLGNSVGGQALNYNWTLPDAPAAGSNECVFRARYNISTTDYVGWGDDMMTALDNGEESPIADNPTVNFGSDKQVVSVKLALNTDQYGRTFEDRSHVFEIIPRPAGETRTIYNLNVRGRRGNIVQTYPSVEYDFIPNRLHISQADAVHIQWTGSQNTPDGAGEGAASTDKSNIVQMEGPGMNYPLPWDPANPQSSLSNMFQTDQEKLDMATAGNGAGTQSQLNNAPSYYNAGLKSFNAGEYHYMCTRNNNFTNRSQKGYIHVV